MAMDNADFEQIIKNVYDPLTESLRTSGYQGETGVQGIQGDIGLTGVQGVTGPTPPNQGDTGVQGIQGDTGIQGIPGTAAAKGDTGLQGQTGIQGITGLRGLTGVGVQGQTGVKGSTGIQGITGLQGQTGVKGSTGIQGTSGPAGTAAATYGQLYHGEGGGGSAALYTTTLWRKVTGLEYTGFYGGASPLQDFDVPSESRLRYTGSESAVFRVSFDTMGYFVGVDTAIGKNGTPLQAGVCDSTYASPYFSNQHVCEALVSLSQNDYLEIFYQKNGAPVFAGVTGIWYSSSFNFNVHCAEGNKGVTGVQGIQGATGVRGVTGAGIQGATGIVGPTGAFGGPQGVTGAQGITGIGGSLQTAYNGGSIVSGDTGILFSLTSSDWNRVALDIYSSATSNNSAALRINQNGPNAYGIVLNQNQENAAGLLVKHTGSGSGRSVDIRTSGSGDAIFAQMDGAGNCGYFRSTQTNSGPPIRIDNSSAANGSILINQTSTVNPAMVISGGSNTIRISTFKTPLTSGAIGTMGDICWDPNYIYICVATNTWKRATLNAF
jgi:hypothetical protein